MKKYLKYFLPLLIFIFSIGLYFLLENVLLDILAYTYQSWFDFFINSNGQELLRQVEVNVNQIGELSFLTAFIDLSNISKSPVKNVEVNIFNEIALPIIFFISSIFILINKSNYKQFIVYFFILLLLLWLKNIIIIYDNFTHPDYILKDLIFPFKQIVYYVNSILQKVGTSFSMMVSVVSVVAFITFNTNIIKNLLAK